MNVLLVSQCNKRALTETRRILDQFAERRGDRTWQTAITMDGLTTLRKLLKKTARKNTAVACHWIRGKDHSELMWVVGDARQFNGQGAVPTNTTKRNVLRVGDENNWHTLEAIKLFSQLAALLHDLGKASIAFQERLQGKRQEKNLYRHEWVSLRLFQAFVGQSNDDDWLAKLADPQTYTEQDWIAQERYHCDGINATSATPFSDLPPLAAAISWLVVTHHRLPVIPVINDGEQHWLGTRASTFSWSYVENPLAGIDHRWNEVFRPAELAECKAYWQLAGMLPVMHKNWQKSAARLAKRLLVLQSKQQWDWLDNPYVMHLSRLCLMLSDHHYSSLGVKDNKPVTAREAFLVPEDRLFANTLADRRPKQTLTEHLLGVAGGAGAIAHALPGFERYLPRLANHRGLRKRSGNARFAWQDKAFDAAVAMREQARDHGAFIINMASTGCGKTLANARILYALSEPQLGMRATYALGLRTLTLQTGRSYRNDLHLDEDELGILVGGSASRALFEHYEEKSEFSGSASIQALIEEDSHVLYEGSNADHPLLERAMANADIRKLLSAPMLVCTVDHLVPATESQRAGRQIAPMLRLMSSDLILDELDDYDLNDLPALTRLVHWAGMLGTKVILSSATLPPALVEGMFMAYRAGRQHYIKNRSSDTTTTALDIPCLWVDEFTAQQTVITAPDSFKLQHQQFVQRRVTKLSQAAPLRRAAILPVMVTRREREQVYRTYAEVIRNGCLTLHHAHYETDPITSKQVSFGIVRIANIEPLIAIAKLLYSMAPPADTHIHLCVYHSRFPLVQRSAIENLLDHTFNRRAEQGKAVYQQPTVRKQLDTLAANNHLFIVLASPVCEVGRDWDSDWALAEPSSMRSFIQLAGRVQRHRQKISDKPNILLLDAPIKNFLRRNQDDAVYQKPGFEKGMAGGPFYLSSHWLHDLLRSDEYQVLSAIPRVNPRPASEQLPQQYLVDLEHARMAKAMYPHPPQVASSRRRVVARGLEQDEAAPAWQYSRAMLTAALPQQQPFRDSAGAKTDTLAFLPDDDEEELLLHQIEDIRTARFEKLYVPVNDSKRHNIALQPALGVSPWGDFDLLTLLQTQAEALDISLASCAKKMATVEVWQSEQGWYWHKWLGFSKA